MAKKATNKKQKSFDESLWDYFNKLSGGVTGCDFFYYAVEIDTAHSAPVEFRIGGNTQ